MERTAEARRSQRDAECWGGGGAMNVARRRVGDNTGGWVATVGRTGGWMVNWTFVIFLKVKYGG